MDYKGTKESKLQEAIKGIKQGCNDQFYKKDEDKIEGLVEEISFVRQVKNVWGKSKTESFPVGQEDNSDDIPDLEVLDVRGFQCDFLGEDKTIFCQELEKDQLAILNKMLDRGKRRKQFESFVSKADLNTGVYKTKTSENQRYITPPLVLTNSHNSISQFSTPCITQRLTSIIQGIDLRKCPIMAIL